MKTIKILTMQDYCEKIKEYLLIYSKNNNNIESYGDYFETLKKLINNKPNGRIFLNDFVH